MVDQLRPVVVLGAGINGAALARELALNGVPVWLVDQADVASGATAFNSRLIHGGLRYLEYGDFDLVRESLTERTRLLRLAPQFVRPLRLFIPVENRFGGLLASVKRLAARNRRGGVRIKSRPRGLWLVRAGVWFYDRWAADPDLPRHAVFAATDPRAIPVDRGQYRWQLAYYDAQIVYPERFVLALLEDARRLATARGSEFRLFTYHRAALARGAVEIRPIGDDRPAAEVAPALIVNATGAWVDQTLARLAVPSQRLIGGTKGSHLVTSNARLRQILGDRGLYAEAPDGRPIFVLPWAEHVLIGTTDLPFEQSPEEAVASDEEIDYLLAAVNDVLPQAALTRDEIDLSYSGVRPLPFSDASTPAAITRRHAVHWHDGTAMPMCSIIGGKLTTCRSLAEEAAAAILSRLGYQRLADSRARMVPGAEGYPRDMPALERLWKRLAGQSGWTEAQVRAVWPLVGTRLAEILSQCEGTALASLSGTDIPKVFARWVIHHEWATTLDDLVERRLTLMYDARLSAACLRDLAGLLIEAGLLAASDAETQMAATIERLRCHYGKRVQVQP